MFSRNEGQLNEVDHIGYWNGLASSDDFAGRTLASCVEVIHADIVGVWNFPDKDRVRFLFCHGCLLLRISVLVKQCVQRRGLWSCAGLKYLAKVSTMYNLVDQPNTQVCFLRSQPNATPGTAEWLNNRYENR